MRRDFGKLNGGAITYAPNAINNDFNAPASAYLAAGWKTVSTASPTDPAPSGYHYEADGWDETETAITRKWKAVSDAVVYRKFSKLKIEQYLLNLGKLGLLDQYLDETYISGTAFALRRFYNQANDLEEDHPMFAAYKASAQAALELTDAEADALLAACVMEG